MEIINYCKKALLNAFKAIKFFTKISSNITSDVDYLTSGEGLYC